MRIQRGYLASALLALLMVTAYLALLSINTASGADWNKLGAAGTHVATQLPTVTVPVNKTVQAARVVAEKVSRPTKRRPVSDGNSAASIAPGKRSGQRSTGVAGGKKQAPPKAKPKTTWTLPASGVSGPAGSDASSSSGG